MKKLSLAVALSAVAFAAPAVAQTVVTSPTETGCNLAPLQPGADACAGYYSMNAFSNSSADVAQQQGAIDLLLGSGNYTVDYNALKNAGDVVSGGDVSALNTLLASASGEVLLGIHWGNVPDPVNGPNFGNVSGIYLWNNVTGPITLTNTAGFSDAVLYLAQPAVPEPATWAMMLLGFGAIGFAMRRRNSAIPQVA